MLTPYYNHAGITIYNENCLDTMARMADNTIDLTVTSPPYDNLRTYNGYEFDFEPIARELFRVTKQGGVVVWVVGDATIDGSETGTSFKQALYFKSIGFNLGDTMIWNKANPFHWGSNNFYPQSFEYMFILTRGTPRVHELIKDRKLAVANEVVYENRRNRDGKAPRNYDKKKTLGTWGSRYNVWSIPVICTEVDGKHPAVFPEQLASDHIRTWANAGDLVYDPFLGSGTTAKMARLNGCRCIGSEISEEYCKIIVNRLGQEVLSFT